VQLVQQIAADEFHPENYEDEVKKRYQEAIQKKIEGQEVSAAPEQPKAQIIDLMEALKASLASKGGATAAEAEERKPAKRAERAPETKAERGPQRIVAGGKSKR
jgi:DNA end-binding protein Ku